VEETGRVIEVKDKIALVQIAQSSMCAKCNACQLAGSNTMQTEVENSIGAKAGDNVKIVLEPKSLLKAAFIIYAIPLIFLILGYLLGMGVASIIGKPEWLETSGVIFGFICFGASYFVIKEIDKKVARTSGFRPVIVGVFRK
jgi:sigma-E factor negative regulatory protein RseC